MRLTAKQVSSAIEQIKKALNISGVTSKQSSWFKKDEDGEGTQVDLIIDRNDNIVDMCEVTSPAA